MNRGAGDVRAPASAHDARLAIGGVTFRIVSTDPTLAWSHEYDAIRSFAVDTPEADVHVRAAWGESPLSAGGELVFDSGGTWQLLRDGDGSVFTFRSSTGGSSPYKVARFNEGFTKGDVWLDRTHFGGGAAVYPLQYPLDELVMIHLLSQGRGIELHGSALVDRAGRAFVFPGQSGAGKSTLARLWIDRSEVTLLSDERVIVRTDGDRIVVHGTPWHGDAMLASPDSGELAGVYFLRHHPTHVIAPVTEPEAAARLLACAFLPFHDASAVHNTVAAADRIARTTRCHELRFAPDRSVVDVLAAHMG